MNHLSWPSSPSLCLADSQFDFPGHPGGWSYFTLSPSNEFGVFEPDPSLRDTATPDAQLTCSDPDARIGRDHVHPGYLCRPGLQWHPPVEDSYSLEGEVALLRSQAHGRLSVRVFIDDRELLSATLDFPDTLRFRVNSHVRAGGFIRVVFGCHERIDNNLALYYLRIRRALAPCPQNHPDVTHECRAAESWAALGTTLSAHTPGASPATVLQLGKNLYHAATLPAHPALQALAVHQAQRALGTDHPPYRQPRFFSIQSLSTHTPHATP